MTPLENIVKILGSRAKVARAIGVHPSAMDWWIRPYSPRHRKFLPSKHEPALLAWAEKNLTPQQVVEIEANFQECCDKCGKPVEG